MTTKADVERWTSELLDAAVKSGGNVMKLRILAATFTGVPRDTALALLQYIIIFMRCCKISKDEAAGLFAAALCGCYSLPEPSLSEVYLDVKKNELN